MYLDIFNEKSPEENFKSLQVYVIILSSIVIVSVVISEFIGSEFTGTMKAINMMTGFWLLCTAFINRLQKVTYPTKIIVYLFLLITQWFVIFIYFVEKY